MNGLPKQSRQSNAKRKRIIAVQRPALLWPFVHGQNSCAKSSTYQGGRKKARRFAREEVIDDRSE
ncbi:MAG: hypothetical protein DME20_06380 [Verrucomicrobia bacterium]|nr:MAG: hypothetical protein DME20_06380 [Verrucomicrobiota bacterium]